MLVREIMNPTLVTVPPEARVGEVAALLRDKGLSGVPVIDGDGRVLGVVTERELVARHARPHIPRYLQIMEYTIYLESTEEYEEDVERILGTTAADVMEDDPHIIAPDADLQDLATLMVEEHANPVLVVEDGLLIGMVGYRDFLRLIEEPASE